jgi:hypothetical protein
MAAEFPLHLLSVFDLMHNDPAQEGRKLLSEKINQLILSDFESLIRILYRLDIDERKLRSVLQQNPDSDAGLLIADMIIEREQKKAETRKMFRQENDISEEDRW